MSRTIVCSCGQVFRDGDEEKLYSLIRGHVDPLHPEEHHLSTNPFDQVEALRAANWGDREEQTSCVVVVEDEPSVAELVRDVLESNGFAVVVIGCPELAHVLDARLLPSLFLVDLMLPGMSGIELATQLQQTEYNHIPMVAMSASPLMLDVARQSGVFADTVPKPFDVTGLINTVSTHVESRAHQVSHS